MIDTKISLANSYVDGDVLADCQRFASSTYNRSFPVAPAIDGSSKENSILEMLEFGEFSLAGEKYQVEKKPYSPRSGSADNLLGKSTAVSQDIFEQLIANCFFESNGQRPIRPYASAGGFYCVQVLIHIWNVSGYSPGTYHVLPKSAALEKIGCDAINLCDRSIFTQDLERFDGASFMIFYAAAVALPLSKYKHAGLRLATLEAGAMYQLVDTNAENFDLGSRVFSCMYEEQLSRHLQIDPRTLWPLIFQLVGQRN